MANTLKTLFTDMAKSIRSGLGTTESISPLNFPAKIDEIASMKGKMSGIRMVSGRFQIPDAELVGRLWVSNENFRNDGYGRMIGTFQPAVFRLEEHVRYNTAYGGEYSTLTARVEKRVQNRDNCLMMGNLRFLNYSYPADADSLDGKYSEFLILYNEKEDYNTIYCTPKCIHYRGDDYNGDSVELSVFDTRPLKIDKVVEHGESKMPDFVTLFAIGGFASVGGVASMTTIRYPVRHVFNGLTAAFSMIGLNWPFTSEGAALGTDPDIIYCPDDNTIVFRDLSFYCEGVYYAWIAIWGLEDVYGQAPPDQEDTNDWIPEETTGEEG